LKRIDARRAIAFVPSSYLETAKQLKEIQQKEGDKAPEKFSN
jgi:hypothetical protein